MIKSTLKFISIFFFFASSHVYASFITSDLAKNTFITHGGYDWTWASPVNVTDYNRSDFVNGQITQITNTFKDADFHTGWMEVVNSVANPNLEQLFSKLTLDLFTDANGNIIHSVAYWNSNFTDVNKAQFNTRLGKKNDTANSPLFYFETFYVRASLPSKPTVAKVPEPTTLFIFGIGLLGFALRKRMCQ